MRFRKTTYSEPTYLKKHPQPLEKHIERAICDYFRIRGLWVFKIDSMGVYDVKLKRFRSNKNPYRITGCSDLISVRKGRVVFMEIKTPKNKQTDSQIEFERLCNLNGALYFVLHSVEEAEEAWTQILKEIP